jgi:putative dehydrogenase
MKDENVGVIGIGAMGMAIARNLSNKGYKPVVRDIRPEAEQQARAAGMKVANSPAAVVTQAAIVLVVVVDAMQIEQVLFGVDGLVRGVVQEKIEGRTVLLCSTIAPEDSANFAQRLREHGIAAIDAPISGGPLRAEAGTMSMLLAAEPALLTRHAQVLEAMSDKRFIIGETVGDAAKAKLVNNLLAGINLVASAEALALGVRVGLQADKLYELIRASSGASWIFEDRMARALRGDFAPRAQLRMLNKDVALATRLADAAGYETPLGDAALAAFRSAVARGWEELDDAVLLKAYLDRRE